MKFIECKSVKNSRPKTKQAAPNANSSTNSLKNYYIIRIICVSHFKSIREIAQTIQITNFKGTDYTNFFNPAKRLLFLGNF
ncbi:MAG: hypothetical protein LBP59_16625 [Planctomycetaceae bacterium]|nr:hypothetical protein [Planctomycetaceae bacterium]